MCPTSLPPNPLNPFSFLICALITALWAFKDFHEPFARAELRNSVTLRRYLLAVSLYIAGALFVYSVLVEAMLVAVRFLACSGMESSSRGSYPFNSAALLLLVGAPFVPYLSDGFALARHAAQAMAFFPFSIRRLLTVLGNVPCEIDARALDRVTRELGRYGVTQSEVGSVRSLARAFARALEIESIRLRIDAALASDSTPQSIKTILGSASGAMYLDYRRFLHHLANGFVVARQLGSDEESEDAVAALAESLEDAADPVVVQHRKIVAQAGLSQIWRPAPRNAFFKGMGYSVPDELGLPFWPVAVSYLAVFLGNAIFWIAQILNSQSAYQTENLGAADFLLILLTQALSQYFAVFWAVVPKNAFSSARPSLKTLPIGSYAIVGVLAYLTSCALYQLMYGAMPHLPFAKLGQSAWIMALQTPALAVMIALLVDLHSMRRLATGWRGRLFDGVALAMTASAAQFLVFRLVSKFITLPLIKSGIIIAHHRPNNSWIFFAIYAAVWFVIGFTLPVTVSVSLKRILTAYRDFPGLADESAARSRPSAATASPAVQRATRAA